MVSRARGCHVSSAHACVVRPRVFSAEAETQAVVTAHLEALALQGAVVARGAVDLASLRTAEAAEAARRTKALDVAASASAVADTAARTAVAVQLQADASAVAVADAATRAALLVAARFSKPTPKPKPKPKPTPSRPRQHLSLLPPCRLQQPKGRRQPLPRRRLSRTPWPMPQWQLPRRRQQPLQGSRRC
jgi:hypothetical protein